MNTTQLPSGFLHSCFIQEATFYYISGSVPKNYFINHVICCLVNVLLALTTIFLNSVTLLTYWKSPVLRTKVTYFMIALLSFADLCVGMVGNPVVVVQLVNEISGRGSCTVSAVAELLSTIPIGMSLAVLNVINIERYIGVVHPIFHRTKVTKQRLMFFTAILWLLCFLKVSLRFHIGDRNYKIVTTTDIVILVVLTIVVYSRIFCAWKSSTRRRALRSVRSELSVDSQAVNSNERKTKSTFLQNVKQAKTFLIVVLCSFLCLVPQVIVTTFPGIRGGAAVAYWSATLILMNSSVNSLILFWRNRNLRSESQKVLRQLFHP